MKLKIQKMNFTTVFLTFVILAMENFAYLIPVSQYIFPEQKFLKFSDIGIIVAALWTVWVYVGIKTTKKVSYKYGWLMVLFIVLIFIAAYVSYSLFAQPISWGIRAMRMQIECFALYFPLTRSLQTGAVTKKSLIHIITFVGIFELFVFTLQYLLSGVLAFTYVDLSEFKNGSVRIRFPYLFSLVLGMICIGNILKGEKNRNTVSLKNLVIVLWSAFLLGGICKHRAPTIILLVTWGMAYFFWKKNINTKIIVGIIILILGIGVISNLTIVEDAVSALINRGSEGDTLSIREAGQLYYINQVLQTPLFGRGFPNDNCAAAVRASGQGMLYFLADNGIMGFFYIYGFAGLLWLVVFWMKNLICSYKIYNKKREYSYLLYMIFETGNLYIGMHWFYYYTLPFILMITLMDFEDFQLCKVEKAVFSRYHYG